MSYEFVKFIHILSSTILFGTGLGTAFQMWMTHLSGDVGAIARVARNVVRADWFFTTPAVVVQPVSGIALIYMGGWSMGEAWLLWVYALYVVTGICWIPVVFLQIKAMRLAEKANEAGEALPEVYYKVMHWWFALGWPAFLAVMAIFWLMVAKPIL